MARLLPSDISELSLSLGETAELHTLAILRRDLSSAYTVFHSVHWSRDAAYRTTFGEIDFIIVNRSGEVVVVEQKAGALEESSEGLIKRYSDRQKNVSVQIHRTLDAIRDQFKRQTGHDINLDYLIYCPDYQVRDLNAIGLTSGRIVDSRNAANLANIIAKILPQGSDSDFGRRVHRFFENTLHLVPDIHAHIVAGERAMARLSGGLADTLSAIEMSPLRLRVRGTAGCGKSSVATQFADAAAAAGKRALLVCFNRPLAEKIKAGAPNSTHVNTFYGLMDQFLKSRGHKLPYERIGEPGFWLEVQERVIGEKIGDDWKFSTLIVDEGQDFEPQWSEILRLFLDPGADLLWLEDLDQSIRLDRSTPNGASACEYLGSQFIGFRARENYRTPETIARYIKRVLPFDFVPANPLPGLGVGITQYRTLDEQRKCVAAIVTELIRTGFKHSDIVILSLRGLGRASLAQQKRIGPFTLSKPTGEYDLLGNQIFESGQLSFDTVYRFKGQQAPAIILTDVDLDDRRLGHMERLLFTGMTRATLRLEIAAQTGSKAAERLSIR